MARVRDAFQIEIPLSIIFETKTLAGLAESIVQLLVQNEKGGDLEQLLSELETLSDAEAHELFAQEKQTAVAS